MPSWVCLAVMSNATFAKKRLVPMPTVAQIPVSSKTVLVSVFAKVTASM